MIGKCIGKKLLRKTQFRENKSREVENDTVANRYTIYRLSPFEKVAELRLVIDYTHFLVVTYGVDMYDLVHDCIHNFLRIAPHGALAVLCCVSRRSAYRSW